MVSNAYQSNLLRFAVGQYRRGVERHRKALRRSHTSVKLSAELGTALVLLPIYMAARISVAAGKKLRVSMASGTLPAVSTQAIKFLNFSDFEGVADDLTPDLAFDAIAARAVPAIARPMFQMLVAVGNCLSAPQLKELAEPSEAIELGSLLSAYEKDAVLGEIVGAGRLSRWVERGRVAARQLLNFEAAPLMNSERLAAAVPRKITGVASDVETRSLLLVLDHCVVWNGLSASQKRRLQRQIVTFTSVDSLSHSRRLMPAITQWFVESRMLPWKNSVPQTVLPLPTCSQSIEGTSTGSVLPVRSSSGDLAVRQTEGSCLLIQSEASGTVPARLNSSNVVALIPTPVRSSKMLPTKDKTESANQEAIETNVVSAIYVEHPLEKMLKWVDRILSWIETRWLWMKRKLAEQIETIFY